MTARQSDESAPVRMIYRRWKDCGTVIALLPDADANPGRVMMYEHIGQHGEGSPLIVSHTHPASLEESDVRALHKELTAIGYDLAVRSRLPSWRNRT